MARGLLWRGRMSRKPKRVVVVEQELLVTGFGGAYRYRIEQPERSRLRSLLQRLQRLIARVAGRMRR
jgi:hypothetical protein